MKFTEQTIQVLKRIMNDLDFEATQYKWGTNEADVLMELIAIIEGVIYLGDGFSKEKNDETIQAIEEGRMIAKDKNVRAYDNMDDLRKALEV